MKKTITLIFILVLCELVTAQTGKEVIYLKNGSVIKGTVIESTDSTTKIKAKDGSVFVYPARDIQQLTTVKALRRDSIETHRQLFVGFDVCPLLGIWNFSKHTDKYGNSWKTNPVGGFVGGFSFAYHRKYVGFETGLSYRTFGASSTNWSTAWYGTPAEIEKSSNRFHNVEIPFLFNAYTKPAKVRFIASIGLIGDMTLLYISKDNIVGNESRLLFKGTKPGGIVLSDNKYWDLMEEVEMGVETSVTKNAIIRICPLVCYSTFEGLMEGIDIKLLFKVKGR